MYSYTYFEIYKHSLNILVFISMRYIKWIGIGVLFILYSSRLIAQAETRMDTTIRRNALRAVPFIFILLIPDGALVLVVIILFY